MTARDQLVAIIRLELTDVIPTAEIPEVADAIALAIIAAGWPRIEETSALSRCSSCLELVGNYHATGCEVGERRGRVVGPTR